MVKQPALNRFELAALTRETDIDVTADESCRDAHDAIDVVTGASPMLFGCTSQKQAGWPRPAASPPLRWHADCLAMSTAHWNRASACCQPAFALAMPAVTLA
jgi:hypothetical protein